MPKPRAKSSATHYQLSIVMQDKGWKAALPDYRAVIGKAARLTLKTEGLAAAAVNIALMNDADIKALNFQFRGKNKPTNVLSFPDGDGENLGDIALALETIMAEAQSQHKAFTAHLSHLVVHGVLHLLGYDHEEESEAEIMEAKEIAILARMAIENPYVSR